MAPRDQLYRRDVYVAREMEGPLSRYLRETRNSTHYRRCRSSKLTGGHLLERVRRSLPNQQGLPLHPSRFPLRPLALALLRDYRLQVLCAPVDVLVIVRILEWPRPLEI